jgi:hypothetical protein
MTVYGICSKSSNSMKSANPHSGIYEADTARTLDTSIPDPNKNAGGMAVVALEGNGSRPSHRGDGYGGVGIFYASTRGTPAVCYQDKVAHSARRTTIPSEPAVARARSGGELPTQRIPRGEESRDAQGFGRDYPGGENPA